MKRRAGGTGTNRKSPWRIRIPMILAVILLILFFPLPKGSYNDGGTRVYDALLYKIVCWNRLYAASDDRNGTDPLFYRRTAFYFYPDNTKSYEELWEIEQARNGK